MLIYILNISLIAFFGLISKKNKKNLFLLVVMFLILALISGLRGINVGTDTRGYIDIFNNIAQNFQFEKKFDYSVEPLFAILNGVVSSLNGSSQSLIMITSIIINFFVVKGILEHSKDKFFSLFLYIGLYHYYQTFNGIRQYIAISLIFFSYKYVKSREFNKFILMNLIAVGFHITALLFIPFYFIYNKNISLKSLILFTVLIFIFITSFNEILEIVFTYFPEYQVYEGLIVQDSGGIRDIVLSSIFIGFGLVCGDLKSTNHIYLTMIAIVYFAFSILGLFYDANLMMRLGWYFSIFMTIYIPNTLNYVYNYKLRRLLKYIILCCVFLLHLYLLNMSFHRVVPYELYFIP